jgi:hypothetical protein
MFAILYKEGGWSLYYNNQIWHWGVKGMKWGVRRYQNADGSLTDAGKRRYSNDVAANAKKKKDNRLPEEGLNDPNRWVKEDRERTKRVVDSGNQMAGNLKTLNDKSMRIQARRTPKMDLSNMTDQEMREQINRAMLERQYDDMFNPKKVYSGREAVSDTLEIAGSVLAITSSALGIALAIKELKG